MSVQTLIDTAAVMLGSKYKVAQALGVAHTRLYDWYSGRSACTPEDQARIAAIGGQDAQDALVRAVIERHEGTLKGEQLKAALGEWNGEERRKS